MIYEPAEDSHLLADVVARYAKNTSFLDVGTGSGIQAETAQRAGARTVLALDIDRASLAHVRKKGIRTRKSDLLMSIKEKFDLIAFNPPYLPYDDQEDAESQRITTGGTRGDELICRFLDMLPSRLTKKGICLLLLSSLTPRDRIKPILKKKRLVYRVVARKPLFMESLEIWKIRRKAQ